MSERLSAQAARRIALAAQGFARPRPEPWAATPRDLLRVVRTVHIVQIDSVNVLTRSHYLPWRLEGPHMLWELCVKGRALGGGAAVFRADHVHELLQLLATAVPLARKVLNSRLPSCRSPVQHAGFVATR